MIGLICRNVLLQRAFSGTSE